MLWHLARGQLGRRGQPLNRGRFRESRCCGARRRRRSSSAARSCSSLRPTSRKIRSNAPPRPAI